ncbi:trithorax group protein osa isoform X6 [Tribolium castaneum]|uniref:trithorax group protein osa isoform X6 n=1 Tax=Tribolium castaneum TaxID=7070 RepID=UPI0030FE26C5
MAATQAEKQQNDVNCEKVQPDQHLNVRNSLLQNGTDKSGVRGGGGVAVAKAKNTGGKNLVTEMSQYRSDGSGGGPAAPTAPDPGPDGEPGPGSAPPDAAAFPVEGPPADGHGYGFSYGRDVVHNTAEGVHAFGPRQALGGSKQAPAPGAPYPQRYVSGQTLSQPTGPTPTLNQLLQSSNPMPPHRYQNSYGHPDQPYNQGWPPQKPMPTYGTPPPPPQPGVPPAPYRNQPTLSPAYSGGSAPSPGYGEGRSGWAGPPVSGQHGPGSPGPPNTTAPASQPSPQPPISHSPGPGLPPSPQHQQQQQPQHQGFPNRPAQPTTPNAHAPDAADLSGGNSNDSSGGPAPGTPNSQGMRPTPSPTGSTGSRSMSPAVASGEDPQCTTPKSNRKNEMGHYSHPTTPQSTVPSPGAASMNSMHDDYEISSPSWPRTPASPVFNSHVPPPDTYRSKKTDSLSKLYEMDDSPDRRAWLDKLLTFMEERRSPITTCPTISKNPLDLFRLYVYVKDRGGFLEVTKNKTWKDIAGMLGIGASSSAAYTLRKHYTKNLLAYECQFDRGGIDPQPIINQVEATSKKKSAKAASVPSPGSSNSQDSFPPPGSGGTSMDGYGYGYPPAGNPEYNPQQRPSSQSNAPSPHGGESCSGGANHLNNAAPGGPSPAGGAADNVSVSNPFDDVSPSPPPPRGGPFPGGPHPPYPSGTPPRPQGFSGQAGYNQYPSPGPGAPPDQYSTYPASSGYPPAVRPVYPPYSGDSGAPPPPNPNNTPPGGPPAAGQDPYSRYNMVGAAAPPTSTYTPRPNYTGAPGNTGPPTSQPPAGPYTTQQDYYRPEQNYPNQQGPSATGNYPGGPPTNKNMPPPGPQPTRRHPDFVKDQQTYPFGQQRPHIYAWSNNNQYRPPQQYGASGGPQVGTQQWNQGGRPAAGGQWDRYPSGNQGYQPPQSGQGQWSSIPAPGVGQNPPLRPPLGGPRPGKPFTMMPPQGGKGNQATTLSNSSYSQSQLPKREITFPPDSVEATLPVLYRRKRLCRADIGQVDPWRIIMCLRSGLLSESTYALDILNVLLYDDSSVGYFGLNQWPGLLDILIEHFQKALSDIFDGPYPREEKPDESDVDLGGVVTPIDPNKKSVLLQNTNNYTFVTRKGYPVKMIDRSEEIFIQDHQKDWDVKGDATGASILAEMTTDPWQSRTDHILPTFQAEFGRIPFHRRLEDKKKDRNSNNKNNSRESIEERQRTPSPPDEAPPPPKTSDKKRRTKTLSDVISRIKKDSSSTEANGVLTLETTTVTVTEKVKAEVVVNCEEQSVDLNAGSVNGECGKDNTSSSNSSGPQVRDPVGRLKRRRSLDCEDEAYTRDEASLVLITESQDNIGKRCVCISNILRSLTFIPGNESEFSRSSTFLAIVGKLLLLHHEHPPRTQKTRNYDREEDADFADSCSSLQGESEWWWDFLIQIRENILVSIANISGQIDFNVYPEEIVRPILDGLLHWAICPSATGQDPFASVGPSSLLSPQRLALESLCKLCVTNNNVDLVIATPPFSRLERLCAVLTKHLCRSEDQVLREFSINLLHYLAAADSSMARTVASQTPCVSLLVAFIEQAEQSALGVANQHGIGALRDNPDSMGTSLDMLRRAAATLVFLARHPDNKPLLVQQESRLLALVMSQILDQQVALLLSKVLFQISRS